MFQCQCSIVDTFFYKEVVFYQYVETVCSQL